MQIRIADHATLPEGDLGLPESIKAKMGLRAGDLLDASFETSEHSARLVLTLSKSQKPEGRIITDPLTGWPVLDFGPNAPELTNEQVLDLLAEFP